MRAKPLQRPPVIISLGIASLVTTEVFLLNIFGLFQREDLLNKYQRMILMSKVAP
jgi:hypothetical protein